MKEYCAGGCGRGGGEIHSRSFRLFCSSNNGVLEILQSLQTCDSLENQALGFVGGKIYKTNVIIIVVIIIIIIIIITLDKRFNVIICSYLLLKQSSNAARLGTKMHQAMFIPRRVIFRYTWQVFQQLVKLQNCDIILLFKPLY